MSMAPQEVLGQFLAAYDQGDWDRWNELSHDDHTFHFPFAPEPMGKEAHLGLMQGFAQAFSDREHVIESTVVEGDMVAVRGHLRLVHTGDFQGAAPTGNTVILNFMDFARIEDQQVREEWVELDSTAFLGQLGLMG